MDGGEPKTGFRLSRSPMFPLWLAILYFASAGISIRSVRGGLVFLVLLGVGWLFETRSRRPNRSFYRAGMASVLLAWLVVEFAVGDGWLFGAVLWLGMTALGLIWTAYYELTEPLTERP
jgi:hypothetical protein